MRRGLRLVRGALGALLAVPLMAPSQAWADSKPAAPATVSLFPKIEGWKISDGPTRYTPETLFEYIDGGAESFLQFDFQDLTSATYANDGADRGKNRKAPRVSRRVDGSPGSARAEIRVDIYHHRDAMRAFGIYTQERPAGTTPLPVGIEAYAGQDYLGFVVGPYYVKMVQSDGKETSVLRLFADKVAAGLPGTREAPAVLKCFPERGKRARAEKLTARDFLGHPFLHDAVAVPYQIGEERFRLFAVEGKDSAEIRALVKRYRAVGKSPAPEADSPGPQGSTMVNDPLNGEVVLQWKGHWLWGAVDQPCTECKALIDELGRSLSVLDR